MSHNTRRDVVEILRVLRRDLDELRRRPPVVKPGRSDTEIFGAASRGQLLAMSATGDSIASGGDYTEFDTIAAQEGFDAVSAAGSSWAHPVTGVYMVSYEHSWDTYEGGGTIQLEVAGILVIGGVLAAGSSGAVGRGAIAYYAEEGQVGKIKVTQSSGSAKTCDAAIWLAITDPSLTTDCVASVFEDNFDSGSASGGWSSVTGSIATDAGPDGSDAWSVGTGQKLVYTASAANQAQRWRLTFDYKLSAYPSSTADHALMSAEGVSDYVKTDISNTGQVLFYANGLKDTSAAGVVVTGTWQTWIFDVTLDASSGSAALVIDGATIYTASGLALTDSPFTAFELSVVSTGDNLFDNVVLEVDHCAG